MDQSVSDRNPTIPSMTVLFRPIQVMFNNVDMINVVTNSNDKERTIPLGTTRSMKSLSSSASWLIQRSRYLRRHRVMGVSGSSPLTIDFTNAPDILEILGLEGQTVILPASFNGSNVIEITRNLQVIQVYLSLDRSSDLKIGDRNNNLFTTLIVTTTCSRHWSLTILPPTTVDWWKTSAYQW